MDKVLLRDWNLMTGILHAAVMAGTLSASSAAAADFTWLNTPASANWNEADANWSGAGAVWTNAKTNNAAFGASEVKSLAAGEVSVSNITFSADGYAISGGTLDLNGNISVGASQSATIYSSLQHAWTNLVLSKLGGGLLSLNPLSGGFSNSLAALRVPAGNTLHLAGGTNIVRLAGSDPESGPALWVNGGTLVVGGGLLKTTGDMYARVSDGGTLLVTNGYVDLRNNTELLNAFNSVGVTTVSDAGILEVNGLRISQNTVSSDQSVVNVNTGGTLRISSFGIDAASPRKGTVKFNGGTVVARTDTPDFFGNGNPNWLPGMYAKVMEGGAVFDTAGKTIAFKHPLISGAAGDGGVTKRGTGTLNLYGTNLFTGGTTVWAGGLGLTNDQNLGAVPAAAATNLTFAGNSTLLAGANHSLHAKRTLFVSNNVTVTFNPLSYTQTVHGALAGAIGASKLVKDGAGSVVFDPGTDQTNSVGALKTLAGTLTVASGVFNITTNAPGSLIYDTLHINGGTVLVAGGTLRTLGGYYAMTQNGTFLITNGTANLNSLSELLNAYSGTGNTTVSGSGVLDLNSLRISQSGGSPDANVVNVNTGGVIRMNRFFMDEKTTSKGRVNFNGGTVVAKSTRGDFMGIAHTNWYAGIFFTVREGGAVIDSNGFSVDSKLPIYSGAANDGGLRKQGSGTFTLANTNMYNGVTVVEGGTLTFGVNNALPPPNTVVVSSNGLLNVNGKTQTLAGLGGSGTVTNPASLTVSGTVAPGDAGSFGTLTFASAPAALGGTLSVNVSTNGACDRLHVNGDLDLSTLALTVENVAQLDKSKRYLVATCSGTLKTPFSSLVSMPRCWFVRYSTSDKTAVLMYNPGTIVMLY